MAFNQAGPSSQAFQSPYFSQYRADTRPIPAQFDIIDWYPQFQSCHKYFLDVAQHNSAVQALAAFMNIQLPYQKQPYPVASSAAVASPRGPEVGGPHLRQPNVFSAQLNTAHAQAISLIPYIRRLIATGHDTPGVLHGFFGDEWVGGIRSLHEIERRNYLFAAKSASWLKVKQAYDMSQDETVPFLSPLKDATEKEIQQADNTWSEWLAMQDWMIGPRAPDAMNRRVKREPRE